MKIDEVTEPAAPIGKPLLLEVEAFMAVYHDALHVDRTAHGIDDAVKLDQQPVMRRDPRLMGRSS